MQPVVSQSQAIVVGAAPLTTVAMKAMQVPAYGLPDVMVQGEVARPVVGDDGVLVRVAAVGLTKGDWHLLTGRPLLMRLIGFGLLRPAQPIPGLAIAGRVEAVGPKVTAFQVGDEVFGELKGGGLAELVCATEKELAHKPKNFTFEQAAALPVSSTTALQGLRDAAGLVAGESVLINGAAGGVGTFAVQIAKAMGATVTAVCSAGNVELMRSIGADHVIDYGQEDFTAGERRYDVLFDLVGNHGASACRRVLTPRGRLVAAAGGADHDWVGPMVTIMAGLASNLLSKQRFVPLGAVPRQADLVAVRELAEAGKLVPAIGRRGALADVPDLMAALGAGHTRGKSVVTVASI